MQEPSHHNDNHYTTKQSRCAAALPWFICFAVPLCVVAFVLLYEPLLRFAQKGQDCVAYTRLGVLCPGCGATRATTALVRRADIAESLRCNAVIVFGALIGLSFYIELVLNLFSKSMKIVPRSNVFLFGSIGAFLVYYVVRNFVPFLMP
ncbi:MAG: DUF2752 domain-containing protein [Oscillospiraceae bacterium]|nr:DUF2752 domain-containing protein [Oscillospiraceae bacterium]